MFWLKITILGVLYVCFHYGIPGVHPASLCLCRSRGWCSKPQCHWCWHQIGLAEALVSAFIFYVCCPKKFTVHCSFNGGELIRKPKDKMSKPASTGKWIEMATVNPHIWASTCGKEQVKQPTTPLASSNWGTRYLKSAPSWMGFQHDWHEHFLRAQDDDCHHPLTSLKNLKISLSMGSMPSYFRG